MTGDKSRDQTGQSKLSQQEKRLYQQWADEFANTPEEVRRQYAEYLLKEIERERSSVANDPLAPWRAWNICRLYSISKPEWVIQAIDRFAGAILALAQSPPKEDIAKEVGTALGFRGSGKGENPFKVSHKFEERRTWLKRYLILRHHGLARTAACEQIAKENKTTKRTVERRLTECGHPCKSDFNQLEVFANQRFVWEILFGETDPRSG